MITAAQLLKLVVDQSYPFEDLKEAEGFFNKNFDVEVITEAMEAYADQVKPQWIRAKDFNLVDNTYYQALRYGIHNYPDTVHYSNGQFYSTKLKKVVFDVVLLMEFTPHPFGNGEVINFLPSDEQV